MTAQAVRIIAPFVRFTNWQTSREVRRAGRFEPERWRLIHEDCLRPSPVKMNFTPPAGDPAAVAPARA